MIFVITLSFLIVLEPDPPAVIKPALFNVPMVPPVPLPIAPQLVDEIVPVEEFMRLLITPLVTIANVEVEEMVPLFLNVPIVPVPLLTARPLALEIVPSLSIAVTLEESGMINPIVDPVTAMLPELVIERVPEPIEH